MCLVTYDINLVFQHSDLVNGSHLFALGLIHFIYQLYLWVNFTNILSAAFMHADPKSAKNTAKSSVEIDPWFLVKLLSRFCVKANENCYLLKHVPITTFILRIITFKLIMHIFRNLYIAYKEGNLGSISSTILQLYENSFYARSKAFFERWYLANKYNICLIIRVLKNWDLFDN